MNAPLRVGVVGCGNVALNFHLPASRAVPDRYRIASLANPTAERLARDDVVRAAACSA